MRNLLNNLFISSPNSGGLFLILDGVVFKLDGNDTTGISIMGKMMARGLQPASIIIYNNIITEIDPEICPFDDIHDVLIYKNNLYIVGTSGNEIIKLDNNYRETQRWVFSEEKDSFHINCLAVWNERVVFSAFGDFKSHRGYKGKTANSGFVQDLNTGERVITGLSQPHSLVPFGKNLLIANSEKKEIREYDLGGDLVRLKILDGYTRGICVFHDTVYVGLSSSRNIEDSGVDTATVLALDAELWAELDRIELPVSEIYAIHIIAERDDLVNILAKMANYSSLKQIERDEQIASLKQDVAKRDGQIASLKQDVTERDEQITSLKQAMAEQDGQIANFNQIIAEKSELLDVHVVDLDKIKSDIEGKNIIISNQQGHINQLIIKERMLNGILESRGWKLLKIGYKIESYVLPLYSKRRLALKVLCRLIKNPGYFLNKELIGKFIHHFLKMDSVLLEKKIEGYLEKNRPVEINKLDLFNKKNTGKKIIFDKYESPLVTVIIPVYNQWDYTYACLFSIKKNTENIAFEIVIADDVSTDETMNIKSHVENITVLRNESNLGFLMNCNNAAKIAKGKYILFLNNDTNVQKNWLNHLVNLLERNNTIGLTGAKLVYSNGRLQEAGGIIWNDASGWNYGRLDDPEKPEYNYVKEVDYISGACIMIRSDLWREIEGFDERFAPAYFEDTDLAFEVRKRGYKVVYQPKSLVVHFEGISHGTDENSGIKSYQNTNKGKFIEKWKDVLERDHFANGQNVFNARDRSRNKKTMLVIDHYVPHYDKDAGSKTTYQYLQLFINRGLNVKFVGDNFFQHEPYTSSLEALGIEVLYGTWYKNNIFKWIKENAGIFDYILLNRPNISIKYIDKLKEYTDAKIIYYGHDLHYLREFREYELTGNNELLKSSGEWMKIEHQLIEKAEVVYYPSQVEIDEIAKYFPGKTARAIPAYIYPEEAVVQYSFDSRKDLVFVGGFSHRPNIDAILWFVDKVYKKILDEIPDIKIYIIGSNPTQEIMDLKSEKIIVTGYVSDDELANFYRNCRAAVVPLRYGAGVKGKVVEAMYYGVPVITTSIGAEGLPNVESVLKIADSEDGFAEAVNSLYNNANELECHSKLSREYIRKHFSLESVLAVIKKDLKI